MPQSILGQTRNIPFHHVIHKVYGFKVYPFAPDHALLDPIAGALHAVIDHVRQDPIERYRPNEVGNDIEHPVMAALLAAGLDAAPPETRAGKRKSTGYPDILIRTADIPIYLEVKTHAADTRNTTQRSFYLSPSDDPKIAMDAHHLAVGFVIEDIGPSGRKDRRGRELRLYRPTGFALVDLFDMPCDLKAEFNSDNRRMYGERRILKQYTHQQ